MAQKQTVDRAELRAVLRTRIFPALVSEYGIPARPTPLPTPTNIISHAYPRAAVSAITIDEAPCCFKCGGKRDLYFCLNLLPTPEYETRRAADAFSQGAEVTRSIAHRGHAALSIGACAVHWKNLDELRQRIDGVNFITREMVIDVIRIHHLDIDTPHIEELEAARADSSNRCGTFIPSNRFAVEQSHGKPTPCCVVCGQGPWRNRKTLVFTLDHEDAQVVEDTFEGRIEQMRFRVSSYVFVGVCDAHSGFLEGLCAGIGLQKGFDTIAIRNYLASAAPPIRSRYESTAGECASDENDALETELDACEQNANQLPESLEFSFEPHAVITKTYVDARRCFVCDAEDSSIDHVLHARVKDHVDAYAIIELLGGTSDRGWYYPCGDGSNSEGMEHCVGIAACDHHLDALTALRKLTAPKSRINYGLIKQARSMVQTPVTHLLPSMGDVFMFKPELARKPYLKWYSSLDGPIPRCFICNTNITRNPYLRHTVRTRASESMLVYELFGGRILMDDPHPLEDISVFNVNACTKHAQHLEALALRTEATSTISIEALGDVFAMEIK
ncbi:MAG: hypothetical protein ABIG71_03725 [Candidatus Uhrbacteria bacterium]